MALLLAGCAPMLQLTPSAVPEFAAVQRLLADRQNVDLGQPIMPDATAPGVTHFQQFQVPGSSIINSMEMHTDGCIYVAYTPLKGPVWYQTHWIPNVGGFPPSEASDQIDHDLIAGASGTRKLPSLKSQNVQNDCARGQNVQTDCWVVPEQAFRDGRGPQPKWFRICTPPGAPPSAWTERVRDGIPHATLGLALLNDGAYCEWGESFIMGPPEWATLLPVDTQVPNGQKKYFPDRAPWDVVNGTTNYYLTWDNILDLSQHDFNRLSDIMHFRGVPDEDAYEQRSIPWVPSTLEGVVTNSFLSGKDYNDDHAVPECEFSSIDSGVCFPTYWQGTFPPQETAACNGTFTAEDALCDDWVVFIKPDPEYRFELGWSPSPQGTGSSDRGAGNLNDEHRGDMENEIEQWLLPGGFRPEAGDRAFMVGRLIVDCGHDDWHSELHPIELVVSQHLEHGRTGAIGGVESIASVIVTSEWEGNPLDFDLWPPARPTAGALLRFEVEPVDPTPTAAHPRGSGIIKGIRIVESGPRPIIGGATHIHYRLSLNETLEPSLRTESRNNVDPDINRRLAARVHIWWE